MSRFRKILYSTAAILIALCIGWLLWRPRPVVLLPSAASSTEPLTDGATSDDLSPTTLYAHNLRLIKGPNFRVYIRWIRGQMLRTHPKTNPSFDDPDSFVLHIEKGVIHANIGDVADYLNASSPPDAPLKHISVQPDGDQIKLHGTVRKLLIPLPVELSGQLSPLPNGRIRFHVLKLSVLKIPMKGLLGSFHVQLSDLVPSVDMPGIQVSGNDIDFDTQKLLPPPHIHGQITSVRVNAPDIEVIYGNTSNDEAALSQWHNFFRLEGGTVDFGKLTMRHADLTLIDTSQDPWFDLDLVHYQAQLVKGFSRMTPQAGLEIFMPDLDAASMKKGSQSITLEWLKNRDRSLPADVPVKPN